MTDALSAQRSDSGSIDELPSVHYWVDGSTQPTIGNLLEPQCFANPMQHGSWHDLERLAKLKRFVLGNSPGVAGRSPYQAIE